jgi:LPXTG-motif cell wall-anchored protein
VTPGQYTLEKNTEELDVYEGIIFGSLYLIKHMDDGSTGLETVEAGAEFEVFLKTAGSYENARDTERDYLITDEHGYAGTKQLPYGVYTVRQTKGTEGFDLAAPFDVFIDKDGCCYQYLLNNAPFTGYLKIQKTDAESGLSIPYAGAAFQIYNPDGTRVTMQYTYPELTVIDTFYTNEEGYLITPEVLPFGKGYSIVEVKAPYGYVLNSDPVYFDVTADSATEDGGITLIEVTRSNMPQKGIIRFFKTGEVFWTVTEADGIYKPVYAVKSLPGAVFEIRAAEDIYTLDGVMHYAKGEIVDTITTESDGVASSKELYLGKYEIREITAPHGMVLNGTIQTVELTYAGQEVAITETAGNLYNERQKVKISLSKVLEQNELFGIGMNGELKNIIFGLYAKTDLVADDGTVIPAGGLIEIVTFDDNGMATVSADLPLGSYYLQERSTDEHYILDDTHYEFEFSYGSQETHMVEISVNGGDPIKNDLKYGMISGRKVDEDGHVIAGAIFGLFRNDENEYTAENAYLTAESAQDGTFKFEKVPFGTWVVREIQPAKGFVLNEKAYPVTVSEDGDVVSFQLENRYIRGNIEGTKLDEDGNVIAGAVFGLFREGETEFTEETAVRVSESDSNGKFRFEDIRYGKWIIRELKPTTGYVLNEMPIEVEITEDGKTVFITVENKFIRGDIKGYKVDEDGKSVVGALFGLFTEDDTEFTEENAVLTAVSDADGIFTFKNVRFGKWIVRELQPAEGFVLNKTEFPVDITTDGAIIEFKAENRHIYGAVHTTKVDKDYPDHLLTGAVFEVYRDVNGNRQFDPDADELVGTLSECEPGLYELAELRYGGYFLYEKQAPVNYVKDNGYYYFEIVTDGEMVKVENQVGIGFINAHMVGSLKIVKASSDDRVEGFSFRITGENYDEVFTTDANGEIFIEHLRIGKYTVTEVEDSASAGYKRPDPFEIELAADETLTVNVHNDKVTTDHPDSPKTGDNSHMALWLGLMLASLGVLIGTILYSRKKKHLAD